MAVCFCGTKVGKSLGSMQLEIGSISRTRRRVPGVSAVASAPIIDPLHAVPCRVYYKCVARGYPAQVSGVSVSNGG